MTYDLNADAYFRREDLERDLRRVFGICDACRKCLDLCPAFVALLDATSEEDPIAAMSDAELWEVVDLCCDCKLCALHCPYVPPHGYAVDFPRLMLRARAVEANEIVVPVRDQLLGRLDVIGRVGGLVAPLANLLKANPLARSLGEVALGLHRSAALPHFTSESLSRWIADHALGGDAEPVGRCALVAPCMASHREPAVASVKAAAQVLWHNRLDVTVVEPGCCGMLLLESGDVDGARRCARRAVAALAPLVDAGRDLVLDSPSCSYMLRREYPALVGSADAERVAARTYDLCEYLMRLHGEGKLKSDFGLPAVRVAYHLPCHLKAQRIGQKSRDLLALIPDTEVEVVEICSLSHGNWATRSENYEVAEAWAVELYEGLAATGAAVYASDCPLSRQQIQHGCGKSVQHPVEILRDAYGLRPRYLGD